MEKLQAQNLSIELQAERDNLKMMQENLKLYPDMSLPTDKETELQAKIEHCRAVFPWQRKNVIPKRNRWKNYRKILMQRKLNLRTCS